MVIADNKDKSYNNRSVNTVVLQFAVWQYMLEEGDMDPKGKLCH